VQALDLARQLLTLRDDELPRLEKVKRYLAGEHDSVYVPARARAEFQWIVRRSTVNVLPLMVDTPAQAMYVDGYRHSEATDNAPAWEGWQANRMDARQTGLHRAMLAYGAAYNLILPGEPTPVWYPLSPLRCTAVYDDPVQDEWPEYALIVRDRRTHREVSLIDSTSIWRFRAEHTDGEGWWGASLEFVREERHDLGVCPVVRYVNRTDLDGRIVGEVEPLITLQDQINLTTFGLLMAQQYAAFRQRWVTGMAIPQDANGNDIEPFNAAVNRLWVGEDEDTKFGEFGQTDLNGYLSSRDSSLRHVATVGQLAPHHLMGPMSNISAEALAAAEIQQTRKTTERKELAGEAHEQSFRLHALASGDLDGWQDTGAQVTWRDVNNVNLAAVADAWGKIATQLQVPVEMLWEKIPGWTQTDVERARAMSASGDSLSQLTQVLNTQAAALTAAPETPPGTPDGSDR
jgi:hypothetical protein